MKLLLQSRYDNTKMCKPTIDCNIPSAKNTLPLLKHELHCLLIIFTELYLYMVKFLLVRVNSSRKMHVSSFQDIRYYNLKYPAYNGVFASQYSLNDCK